MPGKDVTNPRGDTGSFRYGTNRKVEITLKKELDDLAKKSVTEIANKREGRRLAPLDEEQKTARKLQPEFVSTKVKEKRKTEPVFHEDILSKEPKFTLKPLVPPYNALDKSDKQSFLSKTRKLPYSRETVISTEDFKKPRITSMGVLPTRNSIEVPSLKVLLEGQPAVMGEDQVFEQIVEANKVRPITPGSPETVPASTPGQTPMATARKDVTALADEPPTKKPAILMSEGTLQRVAFVERQMPTIPASSLKKKPRRGVSGVQSSMSVASSLRSENIQLPDEAGFAKYDRLMAGLDEDLETAVSVSGREKESPALSSGTVMSTKDLLEEAKKITRKGAEPMWKLQGRKSPRKKEGKKEKKEKKDKDVKVKEEEGDGVTRPRSERSVDEIIASLRAQSTGTKTKERKESLVKADLKQISEADRKIQEIMDRVMSRASAVLSDDNSQIGGSPDPKRADSVLGSEKGSRTPQMIGGATPSPMGEDDEIAVPPQIPENEELKVPDVTQQQDEDVSDKPLPDYGALDVTKTEDKQDADASKQVQVVPPLKLDDTAPADISESEEEEWTSPEVVDIKQAWEDLRAPPEASFEDIISIAGQTVELKDRQPQTSEPSQGPPVLSTSVSFLSTWKPISREKYELPTLEDDHKSSSTKHVHHFCTVTSDYQLPEEFRHLGRKYHVPNRFDELQSAQPVRFGSRGPSFVDVVDEETRSQISRVSETKEAEEKRLASAAKRVLEKADKQPEEGVEESFDAWQERAEEVFQSVSVEGTKIELQRDESRLYWTPAPPKLDVPPAKVRDVLFPEYQPAAMGMEVQEQIAARQEEIESSEESEEESEVPDLSQDRYDEIYRVVYRKSDSFEDLTNLVIASRQREEDIKMRRINPYEKRKLLKGEEEVDAENPEEEENREPTPARLASGEMDDSEIFPVFVPLRRSRSDPGLSDILDDTLLVPQDFNTAMDDIITQKANIRKMKLNKKLEEIERLKEEERMAKMMEESQRGTIDVKPVESVSKKDEPTPAELALAAGRAYVILPKKNKKKKRKGPVSMARIEEMERFLRKPPNKLKRTRSMTRIPKPLERELRIPAKVRQGRKQSLPSLLNFDAFSKSRKMPLDCDVREWVRDIWNVWFDQVFPPTPSESEESDYEAEPDEQQVIDKEKEKMERRRKDSLSSYLSDSVSVIEPLEDSEQSLELQQIMYEEIEKLTTVIGGSPKPKAFDLCRRGALYRKVGMVKAAQVDLDLAIKLEPNLLDAYWHRHLLYLLQDKKDLAKKDLQYITKYNLSHAGAYRSMAEILMKEGQFNEAIINYQKAIKLNPKDHEAYFQLAAMYEKTGQMTLALDNYMMCKKIRPSRTDAILKHGMYYFNQRNWNTAIVDFTDLLKVDSLNANARMFRGRAYAELKQWNAAVEDLSAAIHLDPRSWEALFHRACILRKAHPKHALHDYSVSLLINDTEDNVMSYLHRGILYNSMNRFEDAIPDFESVLKLNKDIACAHVNLGLIFMNHYENYHRAIKKFSAGIKVDPTYVRAYVCRGEAYHKIHELRSALNDFTRAIHLRPDVNHYYMYRGQLVLELGNLDLAAFCVRMFTHGGDEKKPQKLGFRHASELSSDSSLGQMPTQQAVVQSFLKNYEKAIEALMAATRVKPVPSLFMLLGKTQMKAKEFENAIVSFDKALQLYGHREKPWRREPWPMEASEAHFLIAMCHMELKTYVEAKESFTSAIKINPYYAEALYQRGISKMKLSSRGLSREGIQDFNRALAINPKIFQAYLSRACYYGMKKNYTKAILNCNEAIKIQPRSVRSYLYRGALKYHIMAYDLAIRDLDLATSIDSMCELAYFNRAVCYQEKKDYQKALKDYGIVLLLGEDEKLKAKVLINRGLLYFERKDYTNALYDFKMAAKLDPADHRILHTLGLCYHKMDRLKESVAVFTKCIENNPFFQDGIIARGNVYMDYGSKGGLIYARRDYERVLLQNPLHLPARVNLAYTLQVSGKFMQAWNQFTTAIEIKPSYKPALEGRAIINLQMSNTFAAYQDINTSIKVSPTAELLTNRGVINQFMQDRVNAMKDYQAAIKMDPTYSLAYFNAANVYFHTRHFRQALEYYGKCVEHNPRDESAFLNRAITKVMLRDAEGALSDFQAAIKLSPYTAHMYFNRGNLYASMEKFDQAEKDYSKANGGIPRQEGQKLCSCAVCHYSAFCPFCSALSLKPDDALVLKRRADVLGKLGRKSEAIKDYRHAIEIQSQLSGE